MGPHKSSGDTCSVAVDATWRPHISHYVFTTKDLRYSFLHGTQLSWVTEEVDVVGEIGHSNVLVFDRDGVPHIAYSDDADSRLKHAYRNGNGEWVVEVVDQEGQIAHHVAFAIGTAGELLIAYQADTTRGGFPPEHYFNLATFRDGAWTIERDVVRGTGPLQMRVGRDGSVHLLHNLIPQSGLKLAYSVRRDGVWRSEVVALLSTLFPDFNLALDLHDRPHASYHEGGTSGGDGAIRYVH